MHTFFKGGFDSIQRKSRSSLLYLLIISVSLAFLPIGQIVSVQANPDDYGYDTYYEVSTEASASREIECITETTQAGSSINLDCRLVLSEGYIHDDATGVADLTLAFGFEQDNGTEPFVLGDWSFADVNLVLNEDSTADNLSILSVSEEDYGETFGNDQILVELDLHDGSSHFNLVQDDELSFTLTGQKLTLPSSEASYEIYVWIEDQNTVQKEFAETTIVVAGAAPQVVAVIDVILDMTVSGMTAGSGCGTRSEAVMDGASGSSVVNWVDLVPNEKLTACQKITISTNAANGYNVYIVQDGNLTHSDGSEEIAKFDDAGQEGNVAEDIWSTPNIEYAHFGVGSDDLNGNDKYMGIPTQIGDELKTNAGICTGGGPVQSEECYVEYALELTSLQEPGDYTNHIEYIIVARF